MLINSRVAARAATSVCRNGPTLDLGSLPDKALEETTDAERQAVAEVIGAVASWPWLGASTASKTLHKKRPALIPILDNMAIFGAYMNPLWPKRPALAETVKAVPRIKQALDWIATDVTRSENESVVGAASGDRAGALADRAIRHGLVDVLLAATRRRGERERLDATLRDILDGQPASRDGGLCWGSPLTWRWARSASGLAAPPAPDLVRHRRRLVDALTTG